MAANGGGRTDESRRMAAGRLLCVQPRLVYLDDARALLQQRQQCEGVLLSEHLAPLAIGLLRDLLRATISEAELLPEHLAHRRLRDFHVLLLLSLLYHLIGTSD